MIEENDGKISIPDPTGRRKRFWELLERKAFIDATMLLVDCFLLQCPDQDACADCPMTVVEPPDPPQ